MDTEVLRIFDQDLNPIGVATREEVHRLGYWHETFHCWFIGLEKGEVYLYFQLRSDTKKDYPNLLDITAAGHILADETVADGIREVKEELGVNVSFHDLHSLGVIQYSVSNQDFVDKELAHTFLFVSEYKWDDFQLQKEEVSGMVKVELDSFCDLWFSDANNCFVEGFKWNKNGSKVLFNDKVRKASFVSHEDSYFKHVVECIENFVYNTNLI